MSRRVVRVQARILEAAVDEPIRMSFGVLEQRRAVIVEVESDDGVVGFGETWANYPPWAADQAVTTIITGIAPILLGSEVDGIRSLTHAIRERLGKMAVQWGGRGPLEQAISGIEIAVFDLLGKATGESVSNLLGGVVRRQIPVYASAISPGIDDLETLVKECADAGFMAIKCRVGFGLATDVRTVETVRDVAGAEMPLYVDANRGWTLPQAVEAISRLAEYDVGWFEEPLAGNRLSELQELFRHTGAAIATGENNYGIDEFARLACAPEIDVLQPDVSKVGGIRQVDFIAELCDATGTTLVPHWYGGPVALAATVQLAAAASEVAAIEYDIRTNPLMDVLVGDPFRLERGAVSVPEGVGLAIELDRDAIDAYTVRSTTAT